MLEPIFSPLDYYNQTAKTVHQTNTDEYWNLLSKTANVKMDENAATTAAYKDSVELTEAIEKRIRKKKRGKGWSIALAIVLWLACPLMFTFSKPLPVKILLAALLFSVGLTQLIILCVKINKRLKELKEELANTETTKENLLQKAYEQVAPLNALFTEYDVQNLATKSFPHLAFDTHFTKQRLQQLQSFGYSDDSEADESVTDTLSGSFYGFPFLYKRELSYYIGTKTYTGSLTIHWTTTKRDARGVKTTVQHTQVLRASVQKPCPYFTSETLLYYAHEEAPNLHFSRVHSNVDDKSDEQVEKQVRIGTKKLEKLAAKSAKKDGNFTVLANSEFEVLFNALNRDDEIAFRYLFTPMAQENMVKLMRSNDGYGDDFDFIKDGKINVIRSTHSQRSPLYVPASTYKSYDATVVETNFKTTNYDFFKSLYFDFAPLMLIPAYQRPLLACESIAQGELTPFTFEAIAARLRAYTAPESAALSVVYKTSLAEKTGENEYIVKVQASSFKTITRVDYVQKMGDDNNWHNVPVNWYEYVPVNKTSVIKVVAEKDLQAIPQHAIRYQGFIAFPI